MGRLLLVDDNPDTLEILSLVLGERYEVHAYQSAAEALAAVRAVKPDLLVLDIEMHPMDGRECLKAIRYLPGYHVIPAIALTAHALTAQRKAFLASGFHAVITKPILDEQEFLTEINRLLLTVLPNGGSWDSEPSLPSVP